jgi:cell division protein FtsN
MALDYNQKKQVNKNRPRKRPVKLLLLLTVGSVISLYGLGLATGWFVFKYLPRNTIPPVTEAPQASGPGQAPPSPTQNGAKNGTAVPDKEPDLTFYYTLPKGEKGVIGSGINNSQPQTPPKSAPPTADNPPVQQKQQSAEKKETAEPVAQKQKGGETSATTQTASALKNAGKTSYTVQVAAYHAKTDALEMKTKLQKIGISSRVEEYSVPGKGIWYRVRSGSKLDKESANKIAAKLGNGAILVTE